jgi:hypothetical protein
VIHGPNAILCPPAAPFRTKNLAENQKIESEKPVLPGIPGQMHRMPEPFGANADEKINRKTQEKQ